jgi:uncharacterized membrane protein YeaQ/YmgE (transglycosylase-associated protein family)
MLMMGWLYIIVIGILAGFLAGKIMRGKGFGLVVDLLLGIVGAFVGEQIFGLLGITAWGLPGQLIMAVVGALLILYVVRLIKKG